MCPGPDLPCAPAAACAFSAPLRTKQGHAPPGAVSRGRHGGFSRRLQHRGRDRAPAGAGLPRGAARGAAGEAAGRGPADGVGRVRPPRRRRHLARPAGLGERPLGRRPAPLLSGQEHPPRRHADRRRRRPHRGRCQRRGRSGTAKRRGRGGTARHRGCGGPTTRRRRGAGAAAGDGGGLSGPPRGRGDAGAGRSPGAGAGERRRGGRGAPALAGGAVRGRAGDAGARRCEPADADRHVARHAGRLCGAAGLGAGSRSLCRPGAALGPRRRRARSGGDTGGPGWLPAARLSPMSCRRSRRPQWARTAFRSIWSSSG